MLKKAKLVADLLKLLSNEHRLLILCALADGPKTVGEIGEFVNSISKSALSQHLTYLKTAGVLGDQKQGQYVTYQVADMRVLEILKVLKKYYCE
jgi:DNA-binding transcriptional ArsR family regulator